MNKDELLNLVGPAVALFGPLVAKYGVSAGDLTAFLTGGVGVVFSIWSHWNMKKVAENAKVLAPVAKP